MYLKWVQDAVVEYRQSVAPADAVAATCGSRSSTRSPTSGPTFLQDVVVAEVIAEKVEGARAYFTTVVKRGQDVLSEVKSTWCCLDATSLRPARLARDVISRFVPPA